MITCSKCGREESRGAIIFDPHLLRSIEYCLFCRPRVFVENSDQAKSVFADGFIMQHVRGLDGKPITVHSVKELRQVEKTHNVALAIMSDDKIGGPPQHEKWAGDIAHNYTKKWERNPDAYRPENVTGVSTGIVQSAADTLVDRPRPLK